jgi:integrase
MTMTRLTKPLPSIAFSPPRTRKRPPNFSTRNLVRDRLLILMAFRHALRVSELVDIRWQQIHLDTATVDIRRAKNGTPGIHGLQGDELRLLRALRREHPHADFVFLSERPFPSTARRSSSIGLARPLGCRSQSTLTCCATLPDTPWLRAESIPGRFRRLWAVAQLRTRSSILR